MIAFTVRYPEDASRVVPLPTLSPCRFIAAQLFALRIGTDVWQSVACPEGWCVEHVFPNAKVLVETEANWHFADGSIQRVSLALLPDAGEQEANLHSCGPWSGAHGVLSNLHGNASKRALHGVELRASMTRCSR